MNEVVEQWLAEGGPQDKHGIPHEVKCWLIESYGQEFGLDLLVETGTCHGAMVMTNAPHFVEIHTIEMFPPNFEISKRNLDQWSHVNVYLGDSAEVLDQIVSGLTRPALFFLDAHYSGGGTARGAVDTPVVRELEILSLSPYPNVILVDDRRLFAGEEFHTDDFKDYPSVDWISEYVALNFRVPSAVKRDADEIVIYPK